MDDPFETVIRPILAALLTDLLIFYRVFFSSKRILKIG